MIIDCISDLHGHYPQLEGGDLLIVAGDLTARDSFLEYMNWHKWVCRQDYAKIIWISGNHDNLVETREFSPIPEWVIDEKMNKFNSVEYLCDSGTEVVYSPPITKDMPSGTLVKRQKFKVWGSPWTLSFPGMNPDCRAFVVDTEEELAEKWAMIPEDVDILVTHSPPEQILDELSEKGKNAGSISLLVHVNRVRPKLHVFGHIHEAHGIQRWNLDEVEFGWSPIFVNASHVNEKYQPVNKPIRIKL